MTDFPNLRAATICARCTGPKDHGLVICRSCNHKLKNAYDGTWGPWEGKLAVIEGGIEAMNHIYEARNEPHAMNEAQRYERWRTKMIEEQMLLEYSRWQREAYALVHTKRAQEQYAEAFDVQAECESE